MDGSGRIMAKYLKTTRPKSQMLVNYCNLLRLFLKSEQWWTMVEAWSSSYTSSWSYHTCQKHVKDLQFPIFCCHLKMVAQEPDRTSCFARVVGPPNGAWWESHWNPLKSVEGHCESMWLAFEMTDFYGFLMFEMMYPWWSIGLECRWNSLKPCFWFQSANFGGNKEDLKVLCF